MELLRKMLKNREENQANILAKRLDRLWTKKQKEKDSKLKEMRKENIKCIRKLLKKRQNVENKYERRDILNDYKNFGSEAYAPLTRHGYFPDRRAEQYQVKNRYLDSYQGLLELEASLPPYVLQLQLKPPKRVITTRDGYMKRKYREEQRLEDIHNVILNFYLKCIEFGSIEKS